MNQKKQAPVLPTDRFVKQSTDLELGLKREIVGLVHLDEFQRIKETHASDPQPPPTTSTTISTINKTTSDPTNKRKNQKAKLSKLSFADEEDESDHVPVTKKRALGKDPTVDTSFLPDPERDRIEKEKRELERRARLKREEEEKKQDITICFLYWNGSGHFKSLTMKKGDTVGELILKAKALFPQLKSIPVESFIYVNDDMMIPHTLSFFELTKKYSKSGHLFSFPEVHNDATTLNNNNRDIPKICERGWYEKNRHVYPASRWETFDPYANYKKKSPIDDTALLLLK